jgi:hypothetical protein
LEAFASAGFAPGGPSYDRFKASIETLKSDPTAPIIAPR